ncbi:hypothetical protein [Hansschlegelia plantiphila]|uniref:DUF4145 domain-containing protein n=1 Tax=Hansschlegelia plantiphila TaxID=374655 RepID=A0A9W6J083_9HYPH|nr:hypothetical protein [Hansschlegelia plantiphila]GLK67039.1 hypothetical protein GCM10008179_06770 [Hansschlegelia plantiphila]
MADEIKSSVENIKSIESDSVLSRSRRDYMFNTTMYIYQVFGLTVAIGSILYFLFDFYKLEISFRQQLILFTGASGLFFAVLAAAVVRYKKSRDDFEIQERLAAGYTLELIDAWNAFEEVAKQILTQDGEKFNRLSIRSVIDRLHREDILNNYDLSTIQEALEVRNIIVHGSVRIPAEKARQYTSKILNIVSKISNLRAKRF